MRESKHSKSVFLCELKHSKTVLLRESKQSKSKLLRESKHSLTIITICFRKHWERSSLRLFSTTSRI